MNKEHSILENYFLHSKTFELAKELLRRLKHAKKN